MMVEKTVVRCDTCRYWFDLGTLIGGECRRNAPPPTYDADKDIWNLRRDYWCGEWAAIDPGVTHERED